MALFDKEYKIMAVKRVEESGRPAVEIARELDLKPNTLYGWIKKLKNMVSMGTMLFLAVVVYMKKMRNFESYVENC